jgi:hypothetical protein
MLDRRRFTFATLVALVSAPAAAHDEIPELQQPVGPSPERSLLPVFQLRRNGSELEIDLVLRNTGTAPVDVLVGVGSRPGASLVVATEDGEPLDEIVEVGRRDVMSRLGPVPRYAPLAAGGSIPLGTYRFRYPASRPDVSVDVTASVLLGTPVVLPVQRLRTSRAGA